MSIETLSRHAEDMPQESPDVTAYDYDPAEPEYGIYRPGRRALGSMAASAAAGEFLRNSAAVLFAGARPEPERPPRRSDEDGPESLSALRS